MSDSIVSALIGAAGSLVGVYVAFWLPQKRRRRERILNLREQGAQVVEPVRNLLLDVQDLRVGDVEGADALLGRWRSELRDPLVAWGMGQGSARISQLSLLLRDAVGDVLKTAREAASNGPTDERDKQRSARLGLDDARRLVGEMRVAIGVEPDIRTKSPFAPQWRVPSGWG